ncbi:MAG TPA: DUF4232 domain-containing protein [Streptosporangiaceae bacterium]|jgi:hypothetical protein
MTASSPARRLLTAAAAAGLAAALAACGTPAGQGAAPAKTITVTVSPPAAPGTPVASTAPAGSPSPIGPCTTSVLSVRTGSTGAAAGSVFVPITFTNNSNSACTLLGYPGVSFVPDRTGGHQIGAAASRNPAHKAALVTLEPGQTGNAMLQIADALNFPASRCHQVTAHGLRVYPPNQTAPVVVLFTSVACAKPAPVLSVTVVVPGAGATS